jgi:hypothetical protein
MLELLMYLRYLYPMKLQNYKLAALLTFVLEIQMCPVIVDNVNSDCPSGQLIVRGQDRPWCSSLDSCPAKEEWQANLHKCKIGSRPYLPHALPGLAPWFFTTANKLLRGFFWSATLHARKGHCVVA